MNAPPPPSGPPPGPAIPPGWQVSWSDQYHQWFYTNQATGATQWEHPGPASPPVPPAGPPPPQAAYNPGNPQYGQGQYGQQTYPGNPQYGQEQYGQQTYSGPPAAAQPGVSDASDRAPGQGGVMGKLGSLDPKVQTALAVGGGLAAGALLEHEINEFSSPAHHWGHQGNHHVLGSMASLLGAAGAGALGAKFFGGKGKTAQNAPPSQAPQGYPQQPGSAPQGYPGMPPTATSYNPPPPTYGQTAPQPPPGALPGGGLGGFGRLAAGGAAGMVGGLALGEATHLFHHNQNGAPAPPSGAPPGAGMGSFFGKLTNSGPAQLYIHGAMYADTDVTEVCRAKIDQSDQSLSIDIRNTDSWEDPWRGNDKPFNVIYQYGDRPMEVCTANSYSISIRPEPLANARMAFINKESSRVLALIWGISNALNSERVRKLETDGELDATNLGGGGYGDQKTLVCFYWNTDGRVGRVAAREGGTIRLPWNPLAKWS